MHVAHAMHPLEGQPQPEPPYAGSVGEYLIKASGVCACVAQAPAGAQHHHPQQSVHEREAEDCTLMVV